MEKIKAKVEQVLHKDKGTTTGTHSGTHTTGTHTGATGTHGTHAGYSDPTGPHDSRLGNKADPRVDSDHVGGYGNTASTGGQTTGHTGGLTGNSGTHAGYHGDELRGNPSHIGHTGHTGGLDGSTARTGGGLTGNTHTHGSDPTGPHDSRLANKLDPRVDSDHVGSYGNTTGTHTGGGLTGNTYTGHTSGGLTSKTYGSDPTGPHDSHLANKVDPRVDSDQVGGYSNTMGTHTGTHTGGGLTGNTHTGHTGGGLTGNTYGSDPTGPHDSRLGNKADPRVDSDHVGGYSNTMGTHTGTHTGGGLTGNTHTGHTGGYGLTGQGSHLPGPAANTAGPHKSDLLNKADPRVDADLDGSKTYGGNKTYGN